MTEDELQNIINKFDETELNKQAIWGIFQYGGGSDESFIKANKEGLELFALELLKASIESNKIIEDKKDKVIPLDYYGDWIYEDADTYLQYIELIDEKQTSKPKVEYKTTLSDKLMPYIFIAILIILVVAIFVGLGTIFSWIF
ncbi:hypothetical protein VB776_16130 [Arcicella sp. DC2W]|uniref:DUF1493 family protein n=1 Tax=Arcicella gelida TaxID=2984195 RepID=A0ABU5S7K4_9BACT|nr:hypothetical protein [Arcicella sp. DC2W]MEA5404461.1 hypothetical protein [Arcicella sp. DC2W]